MASHIITLSSKGQFTLPVEERRNLEHSQFLLERKGKAFILQPVEFQVIKEDLSESLDNFGMLASDNLKDLWDNTDDDVYQDFYSNDKNRL